ncbi:recombination regulator RecX [Pisciglobus halotolerans]|uniref:Regulatory protein RecX n=1 Tax=Pisciglobus halotolerans TaxID=745365 RepID=A0A1I3AV57_9LACT|nr:recombination regulator RecX [Pisciglobus halotolerans]SFH53912.1 regulatory protein [Pisciglobus halotolerans]
MKKGAYDLEAKPESSQQSVPKITKIETQKRKGRYNVYLDGEYAFPVGEGVLIRHALYKGMEISKELQQQLETEDVYSKAYSRALDYLSHQLRSEKEIRDDLRKHEFPFEAVEKVLAQLKEMNYVDDLMYAESYTRTAANLSGKGPYAIRQELKKRGVKETDIEQALLEYPIEQRIENGIQLAEKAIRRAKNQSSRETENKVRQHLAQKGFNGDEITEVMHQLAIEKDEDEEYEALKIQGEKIWRKQAKLVGRAKIQKVKSALYQKGFPGDLINRFINDKEMDEEV